MATNIHPRKVLQASTVLVAALWIGCAAPPAPPTDAPEIAAATEEPPATENLPPTETPAPTASPTPTPEPVEPYDSPRAVAEIVPAPRVVGYFSSWGIYARNYHVRTIVTSGSAEKLTVINYAFAGPINNHCALGDPGADSRRIYGRNDSVDGEGNGQDTLRGHFGQLVRLKRMYPNLKVLIAIGGWTFSAGFSDAALPENREAFVASCVDMFIHGNLPGWDTPGVAAGVFDGIDIDWEYPAASARRGHIYRPEDTRNFTLLLAEFRRQLDAIDPNLLLTIAAPAGEDKFSMMELDLIHPYLDWINLMTYDYHGAWDAQGPTNFLAPLYPSADDPSGDSTLNIDYTVQAYLQAGVPAHKLNLGIPFYGRGWTGVADTGNGLY